MKKAIVDNLIAIGCFGPPYLAGRWTTDDMPWWISLAMALVAGALMGMFIGIRVLRGAKP